MAADQRVTNDDFLIMYSSTKKPLPIVRQMREAAVVESRSDSRPSRMPRKSAVGGCVPV